MKSRLVPTLTIVGLALVVLTVGLIVWLTHRPPASPPPMAGAGASADASLHPPALDDAAQFGAPKVRTESIPTAPLAAATNSRDLPAEKEYATLFAKAEVVTERATPPDPDGRFTKTRLLKTREKYPFVRVEERWQRDAAGADSLQSQVAMVADHFLARLSDGRQRANLEEYIARFGGKIRRAIPNSNLFLVQTSAVSLDDYERTLIGLRGPGSPIKFAEPDYVVHALMTPNDPSYSLLWGMNNTGQTAGVGDADIDAPEAWDLARGSSSVVVGIIDTGIDYTHPDLQANSWVNAGEIPNNGIDDDGNGYIDDTRGWDFVNEDNNPMDDHYHGTHCAGTIGAVGNNGIGVVGVCQTVRLMPLKFLSAQGSGYNSDAVEAVLYATRNGAHLTSNSWGGGGYSQALKDAIDQAGAAGILFVAAAGNSTQNTDAIPNYPSCYNSPNVIAVAATDDHDALASFSNYGVNTVHLGAPGVNIYSTAPGGGYRYLSGTSMACPHVAGACALIKSARPEFNWNDLKTALLSNTDGIVALNGKAKSGRLNIARALLVSSGPYVTLTSAQPNDSAGNNDGIINPGEAIKLPIVIKNAGSQAANGLATSVSVTAGAGPVQITNGTQSWGTLAANASVGNAAVPFTFTVAAGTPTPFQFTLHLTTTDTDGHSWASDLELTAYTSVTASGRVSALTGGAAISGATVSYSGPISGSVLTDASGNYTAKLIDGTYSFRVAAGSYNTSNPLSVTVPPAQTGVNFALGRSQLQVTPASLSATQYEDATSQQNLTLRNTGDLPLVVTLGTSAVSSLGGVMDLSLPSDSLANLGPNDPDEFSSTPPPTPVSTTATTPLPFVDGFESGSLSGWSVGSGSGVRDISSQTVAAGAKSFHQLYTGPVGHFTGISRSFDAGGKPSAVSFWIRSASTSTSAAYFVLYGGGYDAIWFFAKETGNLYVNGDESQPFLANVWYHVEFRDIDWTAKNFDYYVNGALVKTNIAFRNASAVAGFDTLYLYNFSTNSEAWWDDVRVLDKSAKWLTYAPSSVTIPAGQTATVAVTFDSNGITPGTYATQLDLATNAPLNPITSIPVTFTVNSTPNTPPVANNQSVAGFEDSPVTVTLDGTDAENNTLTAVVATLPSVGTLYQTNDGVSLGAALSAVPATVTNSARKVIFVPPPNANGSPLATFTFQLQDKRSTSNTATASINVTPVNDAPVAMNDSASALPGVSPVSIAVLANDTEPDGQALTITGTTQGLRGAVAVQANQTINYTPNANFTQGTDSFTYTVSDGSLSSTATVYISIGYLSAGAWPTMGNGADHTGYYPASLGGLTLTQNWALTFDLPLNQVAIAEGKVFATRDIYSHAATLTAVDLPSGMVLWRKELPQAASTNGPSYRDGKVYFQRGNHASDTQLWSVSAADGSTIWSQSFAAQWQEYLPAAVTDTSVFINGGYYGGMYGYQRDTGTQLFFHQLPQVDGWTPTVGNQTLYTCVNGILISHSPTTGARNWTYTVNSGAYGATVPAYSSNRVYVVQSTGLFAVNVGASASSAWTATGAFVGYPAVANGRVYAIASAGYKVQSFDAATGAFTGDFLTGTESCSYQPIITNDCLIVSSYSKTFVFRLSDRVLLQTIPAGGWLSLSNGCLLIAGNDSILRSYVVNGTGNPPPVALAQTVTGIEDSTVTITLNGSDANGNPIVPAIASLPAKGTLYQTSDGVQVGAPITMLPALVTNPARKVIYRPPPDAFGPALSSFDFRVNNGNLNSANATVTINVTNVNDPPTAVNDQFYVRAGEILSAFWPSANDIDADGETLAVVSFTQPGHGTVSQNADGSLRYAPQAGFVSGVDTFAYTIRDAANVTSTATVDITISDAFGRDWPTFGNGPDHVGRYPGSLGTTPFTERWQYSTGAAINPIVVADGRIYFSITGNFNNYMYAVALDATAGAECWRAQFKPAFSLNPPTYYKGKVYLQRCNNGGDTDMWALDATSGNVVWKTPFGSQWERYMAPAVDDSGVYVDGGTYGGIYGFDRLTGTQKFFLGLDQCDGWTPSLYGGGAYTFTYNRFRSHDRSTGAILWQLDLGGSTGGGSMSRTIAVEGGLAFVVNNGSGGNELVCIDLNGHNVRWRVAANFSGTPALMGGIVYANSGGTVKTYGMSSGTPLGDFVAPGETALSYSPTVAGDALIVASGSKTYLFNLATRQIFQTLTYSSQPAIVDNVLYLACSDNKIRALGRSPVGNIAPVARAAQVGILEEAQVAIQLEASDANNDPLRFSIRSLPASGTLYQTSDGLTKGNAITAVPAVLTNPQGLVIYQAPLDVFGQGAGTFTFAAHDPYATSALATVQVNIAPINDPPVAVPDRVALRPGQILSNFSPQNNDRDVDGDVLTVSAFTQGALGQVSQSADGSLQYVPNAGFNAGTDAFNYTIRDAAGAESSSTVTIVVSATLGREWPTFGGGADHTGYLPTSLGGSQFTLRWANNLGKVPHQVAVSGGRAYTSLRIYFQDTSLVAIDSSTGGELWRVNYTGLAYMNPPTFFGADVFFQASNSSSSRIYALNGATGTQHWASPFVAQWEQYLAPAVDSTGVFVDGGTYGGIYAYNPTTGTQQFFVSLDQYDQWTPTLYNNGLYSFMTGKFRSHNKTTGAVLWTIDMGWDWAGYSMNRTVACADNRAYLVNDAVTIPSGGKDLTAIDLATHAIVWTARSKFLGTPATAHQAVFAINAGASVDAYDSNTGTYLGTYVAPGETALAGQPIVTNDTVIVASATKTYLFDLKSRALRQTLNFGGTPSLAGESLYLACPDNYVRTFGVPDPLNRPPVAQAIVTSTPEDVLLPVSLTATDADQDALTYVVTALPSGGTLYQTSNGITLGAPIATVPANVANPQGKVIYVPPQDRNGSGFANFQFAASDGKGTSPAQLVTVTVTPVNDAPIAFADVRQIEPGQILSPVRETLNDFDADGDALTVVSFTQPVRGLVARNSDGTLRYVPPAGATSGSEQFSYTIEDAAGARSTATVSVSIVSSIQGFWPTFGNGPDHTGYTSTTLGRSGWITRWSYSTGASNQQAAIAAGRIYLSSMGGTFTVPVVTALDEKTGTMSWQKTLAAGFSLSAPTFYSGRLYVQRCNNSSDTQLYGLDATTGAILTTSPFGSQWENYLAPAVSDLGVFIDGGTYGGLYGFHRTTGAQLFFRSMPQTDGWTPSILGGELFSFVNGTFTSHQPSTGATIWSTSLGWGGYGYTMGRTVALQGRSAYLVNDSPSAAYSDEDLVCLNLDTHAVTWSVNGDFTGTPAVNNGLLYTNSANTVQARSCIDGRLLATFSAPAGEYLMGQPILTDDLIIVASTTKTYLFGRYDQSLVATFNLGGAISVADDQLIVASPSGTVSAFAAQPAVTFNPPGGTFSTPVNVVLSAADPNGRIYYTVDGTAPTLESAWVNSGQTVRVNWSGKIRAILVRGSSISRIAEANFTMTDADADGLPDWWEGQNFGSLGIASASTDTDGDGISDYAEFIAGTNPRDPSDKFELGQTIQTLASGQIQITWASKTDRIYLLQESPNLVDWSDNTTPLLGTGATMLQTRTMGASHTFYRLRVLPRVMEVP